MSETYAGKPIDKHPSSAPKKEYPDAFSGIGAEYSKAALNFPTELERLRAENARLRAALKPLSEIADNHSDKRDDYPLYVRLLVGELRAARTAMGETE